MVNGAGWIPAFGIGSQSDQWRVEQVNAFAQVLLFDCSNALFWADAQNGAGGIRTPVTRKGKTVFKTVAMSRSATAPGIALLYIFRAAMARGTGIYDL